MPPTRSLASRPVWLLALCAALALLVAALLPARIASACAAVFRPEAPVHIKGEEALIVWDPQRGRQHFIRKAGFEGATEDFGFLVPTPGRPMLGEADAAVFRRLFELYRRTDPAARGARGRRAVAVGAGAARPAVTVIERRVVAGLDAAVLAANDAGALDRWLEEHRYPSGEPLREWLTPYVERGWFITAFRYAASEGGAFSSNNVRMSFDTDVPFFPYSEPRAHRRGPARPFRVSVIAPYRVDAREGARPARIRAGYADRLPALSLEGLLRDTDIPAQTLPRDGAWLTVFDEHRSRRGAHDLTFVRAAQQRAIPSRITRPIVASGASGAASRGVVSDPWAR